MIVWTLFLTFLKIGAFTFGGGYAMVPFVEEEVIKHSWMSMTELVNFIAVSESTPGSFAVNISTYIGAEAGGFPGALFATLGVVLPSFIIILLVAKFYDKFKNSRMVTAAMNGLRPAVVGLIGAAAVSIGTAVFFPKTVTPALLLGFPFLSSLAIFLFMLLLEYKRLHPILIILLSAVLGIICGYAEPFFH